MGQKGDDGFDAVNGDGFDAVDETSPYFFLEEQSRIERQTMDAVESKYESEEDEIKRRTLKAFGEIVETFHVSHRLGNALLHFLKNPLFNASSLDLCLKTVIKKYRKILTEESNNVELNSGVLTAKCNLENLLPVRDNASALSASAPFHRFRVGDALRTLVQGTPQEEGFVFEGTRTYDAAGKRVFSTLETAKAWERHEVFVKSMHNPTAVLGAIILYADETCLNTIRGR